MIWSQDGGKMILSGIIIAGLIIVVRYLYNKYF